MPSTCSRGNIEGDAALGKIGLRRGARHRGAHGVAVVLDDVDHRKLPQLRHVEALIDLALVRRAIAEVSEADEVIAAVAIGKGESGTERDLRADDAVTAVKILLLAEHVHGAALTLGIAAMASGQLGHDALGVHAASQHVAVIAIAGDHLIAVLQGHLHADHDGFLADIEMAKAADRAHAVELSGLFLEAPDQQHVAQRVQLLVAVEIGRRRLGGAIARCLPCRSDAFLRCGHENSGCESEWPSLLQLPTA
ncbi:hypothetical protein V1282_001043 [Nitrobacteraceae bacterium AZCC 2146]